MPLSHQTAKETTIAQKQTNRPKIPPFSEVLMPKKLKNRAIPICEVLIMFTLAKGGVITCLNRGMWLPLEKLL